MEQMAIHWTNLGLSLAGAFLFGILFAGLVHWSAKRHFMGQTAFAVIIGVTGTLVAMIPVFGLSVVAIIFLFFFTSGVSMIVEYLLRVAHEAEDDAQRAKGIAKDLLK